MNKKKLKRARQVAELNHRLKWVSDEGIGELIAFAGLQDLLGPGWRIQPTLAAVCTDE